MKRLTIDPRPDHGAKLEEIGLSFHGWDGYWKEDACYEFTADQVDMLEAVTQELHGMCLDAVRYIIERDRFAQLGIPVAFWDPIRDSFKRGDQSLYGRFDFAYDGINPPKMLEYNADTPTSLLESAVAQWYWLEEKFPRYDQFNSLHEKLVERWKQIAGNAKTITFASVTDNEEDWVCVHYMMDTAIQAGFEAKHIYVEDIGWNGTNFIDLDKKKIEALFKLYPWEWVMREPFGEFVPKGKTQFIEPTWKSLLACKGLLPILWEMHPGHENLLAAYFEEDKGKLKSYAKKPLYSREGANVELFKDGELLTRDRGPYGGEGHIYQELFELPCFDGKYPVIGSWVVGDEPAGMCIREDKSLITTNLSNFVPHYFK